MNRQAIEDLDLRILKLLAENAACSYKEIGSRIHLTGQAVGARVRKLEDMGIIEGYTLKWNPDKIGIAVAAFVTVYMKSPASHSRFHDFVQQDSRIEEAHRVSGEGCYMLKVRVRTNAELTAFLDELLQYGNYKLSTSIDKIK